MFEDLETLDEAIFSDFQQDSLWFQTSAYLLAKHELENRKQRQLIPTYAKCLQCGATFDPSRPRQKFCSYRCRHLVAVKAYNARKAKMLEPKQCAVCAVWYNPSRKDRLYCSRYCSSKAATHKAKERRQCVQPKPNPSQPLDIPF